MLRIDWRLSLLALLPLPLVSASVRHFGKRIHDLTEQSQAKLAELSARVQEGMAGIRIVKAFVQEHSEIDEFDKLNRELVGRNRDLIRITSIFSPTMQLFIGFAVLVVSGMAAVRSFHLESRLATLLRSPRHVRVADDRLQLGRRTFSNTARASMEPFGLTFQCGTHGQRCCEQLGTASHRPGEIRFQDSSFSYNGVQH